MDIAKFLPYNEYQAAVGANAPSSGNVYATIADLSGGGGIYGGSGSLSGATIVTMGVNDLTFAGAGQRVILGTTTNLQIGGVAGNVIRNLAGNIRIEATALGANLELEAVGGVVIDGTLSAALRSGSDGLEVNNLVHTFTDNSNLKGIEYAGDYSANFTNESLVTKRYVDNAVIADTSIYTGDGTLTGNRVVTLGSNLLTFTTGSVSYLVNTAFTVDSVGTVSLTTSGPGGIDLTTTGAARPIDITATGDITLTAADIILADGTQGTVGHVWTQSVATGEGGWAALPTDANTNIYNTDDFLTANRTVSLAGNDLSFNNAGFGDLLYLDATNNRVGIGTNAPLYVYHQTTGDMYVQSGNFAIGGSSPAAGIKMRATVTDTDGASAVVFRADMSNPTATGNHLGLNVRSTAARSGATSFVRGVDSNLTGSVTAGVHDIVAGRFRVATTVSGGTLNKYALELVDGTEGTAGHVWASVTTTGLGHWVDPNTLITAGSGGIYTGSGSLSGATTVTMGANALTFSGNIVDFTSGIGIGGSVGVSVIGATMTSSTFIAGIAMNLSTVTGNVTGASFQVTGASTNNIALTLNAANGTSTNYALKALAGRSVFGASTSDASALVSMVSTTQGFLMPRMTAAQRAAIGTPATGLQVYQTDDSGVNEKGIYFNDGTNWLKLAHSTGEVYTPTNVSTDRAYDANSTTVDELADVIGTLIADLKTSGIID